MIVLLGPFCIGLRENPNGEGGGGGAIRQGPVALAEPWYGSSNVCRPQPGPVIAEGSRCACAAQSHGRRCRRGGGLRRSLGRGREAAGAALGQYGSRGGGHWSCVPRGVW